MLIVLPCTGHFQLVNFKLDNYIKTYHLHITFHDGSTITKYQGIQKVKMAHLLGEVNFKHCYIYINLNVL